MSEHEDERLIIIEPKLAYQDKTISELSDVIVDQARAIDALKAELQKLDTYMRAGAERGDMPHEKPPHY